MATAAERITAQRIKSSPRVRFWRHLLLVLVTTSAVTLIPVVAARTLENVLQVDSILFSIAVGAILSVGVTIVGARLWSALVASDDIVFGELMLWGWVRRLRSEARLARATDLMGLDGKGWAPDSDLSPDQQTELLHELADALEVRDPYTHGHTNRVTRYSNAIARGMGLDPASVENIRVASSLHDVGKIHVPLHILRKPGALTDEEFAAMKDHAALGSEMVKRLGNPEITAMVRHHHERLDGRGYPDRLSGDEIPLGARIIAVADTFDAICSTRSYRKASNHKKALSIIKKEAGTQLDRAAVEAFVTYYSGRGSFEWRASMTTIPQRLVASIGRSVPGGVAQGAAAAVLAVGIAHAPVAQVQDVAGRVRDSVTRSVASVVADDDPETAIGRDADAANDAAPDGSTQGVVSSTGLAAGGVAVPGSDGEASSDTGPGDASPSDGDGGPAGGTQGGASDGSVGAPGAVGPEDGTDGSAGDVGTESPSDGGTGTGGSGNETPGGGGGVTDPVDDAVDDTTDLVDGATGGAGGGVTDTVDDVVDETTDTVEEVVNDPVDAVQEIVNNPPLL